MKTVVIEPNFDAWRTRARQLLAQNVDPGEILWETDGTNLFAALGEPNMTTNQPNKLQIPRKFFDIAQLVACNRAEERWAILYRVAWRIALGGERHLLHVATDSDVRSLQDLSKAVSRDRHKMKAFVRFRKVGEHEPTGREQFAAWFEPEHRIVELTAPFFAKRFAGMDWSILTPNQCAHWDGEGLTFTAGVSRGDAPSEDALEDHWRTYYANIFNPARLKLQAMQSEMPKKYWKNLPEAPLIAELASQASLRTQTMVEAPTSEKAHVSERVPTGVPDADPEIAAVDPVEVLRQANSLSLAEIREQAEHCHACELCQRATQTVFGQGPEDAELMIVGEQPGDLEDLHGKPFVGPAGQLLDEALAELGIEREKIYLSNVVKHFKWKRQGKRRLHQNPNNDEMMKCRPWVLAEALKVQPKTIICLGATTAKALIRPDFRILEERGLVADCALSERVVATVHPSFLLRIADGRKRIAERQAWIEDLKLATP